ncbi:hypothetical protein BSZ22_05755 [Bradyrhizobium canariense]|uniref:Uncharacterized protein n=1 Tax=Bradyrhizobium canariense TaxID=255045 RepID=A0A1X3HD36_9BRAD|nr:hypothetical protein BSZ21_14245 [Bradyrhizobium canariense]OSI75573.1 hypothetical protein BSZ22_05755 [Bradyrhizobium canariense]OSI81724.1 hypothetical protein BSZ23_05270 [Bradyrhizobium canariense]OSI94815.1 hypothetical protein BSZ25_06010 [Bradyrhizobium canariense]OSI95962.1 hypothetical protein BSZ24_06120 [Bradyrhizobium canariense]
MIAAQLSSKARIMNVYNNIPNIADIRTRTIADTNVREARNIQFSQKVGVFADSRTTPPLRGDALSAIPQRAEKRAALRAAAERFSFSLIDERCCRLGRTQ